MNIILLSIVIFLILVVIAWYQLLKSEIKKDLENIGFSQSVQEVKNEM